MVIWKSPVPTEPTLVTNNCWLALYNTPTGADDAARSEDSNTYDPVTGATNFRYWFVVLTGVITTGDKSQLQAVANDEQSGDPLPGCITIKVAEEVLLVTVTVPERP